MMPLKYEPLLTIADWEALPDDGKRYEVIEGELSMSCAPSLKHQIVLGNLYADIRNYLNQNPLGLLIPGPGVIFSEFNGVIPDLVFIRQARLAAIASGERIEGAPDLVIEIVSPGAENSRRDRLIKRQLYGKHGVQEYWIVDPEQASIELYTLQDQLLRLTALLSGTDELTSFVLPDYRCLVAKIFNFNF
jgi:Uma2 family endonuclease